MSTLEGRNPLIAVRTRGAKPASLLQVLFIAAVTLGAAAAIAFAIHHSGGTRASQQPAVAANHAPATHVQTTPLPPGVRYDGGPEEGTRGPLQVAHPSPNPPAVRSENGPQPQAAGGR